MTYFPVTHPLISTNVRQFLHEKNLIQGLSPTPVRKKSKRRPSGKKVESLMEIRKNRGKNGLNKAVKETFNVWRIS